MERTASVVKGSKLVIRHDARINEKSRHVNNDLSNQNIIYFYNNDFELEEIANNVSEERREALCADDCNDKRVNALFEDQIELYNSKQKRADRKIEKDKFFEDCRFDKRGQGNDEIILQIGSKNDFDEMTSDEILAEQKLRQEVLTSVIKKFDSKFPNLKVLVAFQHLDEDGSDKTEADEKFLKNINPHIHASIIGFSELKENKSGTMTKPTTSTYPAILEMYPNAYESGDSKAVKNIKAFTAFRNELCELLHSECLRRDQNHVPKYLEENEKSESIKDFKMKKINEKEAKRLEKQSSLLNVRTADLDTKEAEVKTDKEKASKKKNRLDEAEVTLKEKAIEIKQASETATSKLKEAKSIKQKAEQNVNHMSKIYTRIFEIGQSIQALLGFKQYPEVADKLQQSEAISQKHSPLRDSTIKPYLDDMEVLELKKTVDKYKGLMMKNKRRELPKEL